MEQKKKIITISKANEKKLLSTEIDFWRQSASISTLKRKINTTVRNLLNVTTNVIKKIDERRGRW